MSYDRFNRMDDELKILIEEYQDAISQFELAKNRYQTNLKNNQAILKNCEEIKDDKLLKPKR